MKRLATLIVSGVLIAAAPVAVAPAQTDTVTQQKDSKDDDGFPYGLLGLLGLAGLAGLKKRNDHDHDVHRVQTTDKTTGSRSL